MKLEVITMLNVAILLQRSIIYVQGGSNMTGTDLCVNSPSHI